MKGTEYSGSFPFFFRKHCGHPCISLGTKQAVINAISFDSIPTVDGCNGRYKAKLWSNRFSKFYGNITFPNNVVMKKKQKKQGIEMVSTTKRFLPVTIPEMLHKTSNDGSKLSLSALVQMKPFFILYPTEKKKIICICMLCFFVREIFSGYRKCFLFNFSIHEGFVQMYMGTNRVLLQEFFLLRFTSCKAE